MLNIKFLAKITLLMMLFSLGAALEASCQKTKKASHTAKPKYYTILRIKGDSLSGSHTFPSHVALAAYDEKTHHNRIVLDQQDADQQGLYVLNITLEDGKAGLFTIADNDVQRGINQASLSVSYNTFDMVNKCKFVFASTPQHPAKGTINILEFDDKPSGRIKGRFDLDICLSGKGDYYKVSGEFDMELLDIHALKLK